MREAAPLCKEHIQENFTGTNRLDDFDWRLDFKVSSKAQARVRQPVLYVKLDLADDKGTDLSTQGKKQTEVLFQMSKGQLKSVLDDFENINQQLAGLAQSMGQ